MASTEHKNVAASQTGKALTNGDAAGQYLSHVIIVPETTSPGNVLLLDDDESFTLFAGGASSVSDLTPRTVYVGANSRNGPWKITTGANVHVKAVGDCDADA